MRMQPSGWTDSQALPIAGAAHASHRESEVRRLAGYRTKIAFLSGAALECRLTYDGDGNIVPPEGCVSLPVNNLQAFMIAVARRMTDGYRAIGSNNDPMAMSMTIRYVTLAVGRSRGSMAQAAGFLSQVPGILCGWRCVTPEDVTIANRELDAREAGAAFEPVLVLPAINSNEGSPTSRAPHRWDGRTSKTTLSTPSLNRRLPLPPQQWLPH